MAYLRKIFLYFLGFVVFSTVLGTFIEDLRTPEEKAARDKARKHESELRTAIANCQYAWETQFRRFMKDPNSLEWDTSNAAVGRTKGANPKKIVNAPYRAKNSYGGLTLNQAICELEINTGKVLSVN